MTTQRGLFEEGQHGLLRGRITKGDGWPELVGEEDYAYGYEEDG
jgi:hypothetical protein